MRHLRALPIVLLLASSALAAPLESDEAAAANRAAIEAHVQDVVTRVNGADAANITIVENAAATARRNEGALEISTGLLGLLTSDAQLAMLLGYEQARQGAPAAPRRKGRAAIKRDDAAVIAGLKAAMAAGFAGDQALLAWGRLAPARSAGTIDPGAPGDAKADHQRAEAGRKWLASASGVACGKAHPGGRIGADEYAAGVRLRIDAWRILDRPVVGADPAPHPDGVAGHAPPTWLTYQRSGGITGWMLNLTLTDGGRLNATESRRGSEPVARKLSADELKHVKELVAQVLSAPARDADASLGSLRDGQMRSLEIREGERSKRVTLSDGYNLFDFDEKLVQLLESFARPAAK